MELKQVLSTEEVEGGLLCFLWMEEVGLCCVVVVGEEEEGRHSERVEEVELQWEEKRAR